MSASTINRYFSDCVEKFISEFPGNTLIFFKGFGIEQIRQLVVHPNSILNDSSLLNDNYIDFEMLEYKWLEIATSIQRATKPLIGFYEELLTIRQILSHVKVEKIVVVENNILSPWVPCCLPYSTAEALFDYWQAEQEVKNNSPLFHLVQMYGDIKLLGEDKALLLPVTLDNEVITTVPFWCENVVVKEPVCDDIEHIELGSTRDWEFCLDITNGKFSAALYLQNGETISTRLNALLCAANQYAFDVFVDELDLYKERVEYSDSQFVHVLQKYWGRDAQFRPLLFYKNPDYSRKIETITQGQIIAEIVDQCEAAQSGDDFSNVFITAPTGSGKSILFQIPAVYLAEKYNLITIVVSPLIALMNDQVDQLQRERGISLAACINSSMSIDERSNIIEQIHTGEKSLIYLAPELLLTTHLPSFLGGRKVGMVVIDEAHTVTSWGRDFRSDYWFLGDFLKKTFRNGLVFPVLCLTATAVYSGEEDVVNDTIQELGLGKTIIHLGNVRRDNISFDIQCHDPAQASKKIENEKMDLTLNRVREYTNKNEKVLAYFPYRSQVEAIYHQLSIADHIKIRRYHGQLPTAERKMTESDFKKGTAMGLFCTKAFGMGVDVSDIKHVIHFAPTGSLADYVQEIGRAARNADVHGVAHIDYFPSDLRYVRTLNGISEMRQYQLREMLKKICAIQKAKKRRNLLISSETFEYLFKENDNVENRTKSGLLLLSKDLNNRYTFPVLIVRPKAMLSKNYINVPSEIENEFLRLYGSYCQFQQGVVSHVVTTGTIDGISNMVVYSTGKTFLVDMAGIWENFYPDRSFGMFKKEFFEKEYLVNGESYTIAQRVRAEIRYLDDYATVLHRVDIAINAIKNVFEKHKKDIKKLFTQKQFESELTEILGERLVSHDKVGLLLDLFTENVDESPMYSQNRNRVRVLRSRKQSGIDETVFYVYNDAYARLPYYFKNQLEQCAVNTNNNSFFRFYPLIQNMQIEIMPLLRFLELLGLASYEIRGGEKAEVFIRVNDPDKLEYLATSGRYTNGVLQDIQKHHRNNERLLAAFFAADMNDDARWELIEQYFLGNEEYVKQVLHITD